MAKLAGEAMKAGALGFNIVKHKLAAFIVSAFFSGLSRCSCTNCSPCVSSGNTVMNMKRYWLG